MRQFFKINSDIVFNNVYLNIKPNACFRFWFPCSIATYLRLTDGIF